MASACFSPTAFFILDINALFLAGPGEHRGRQQRREGLCGEVWGIFLPDNSGSPSLPPLPTASAKLCSLQGTPVGRIPSPVGSFATGRVCSGKLTVTFTVELQQ